MNTTVDVMYFGLSETGEVIRHNQGEYLIHVFVRNSNGPHECMAEGDSFYTDLDLQVSVDSENRLAVGYVNADYDPDTQVVLYYIYNLLQDKESRISFIKSFVDCINSPVSGRKLIRIYDYYVNRFIEYQDTDLLAILSGCYTNTNAFVKALQSMNKEPYVLYSIPTNYLNAFTIEYILPSGISLYDTLMSLMTPSDRQIWLASDFVRSDHPMIPVLASQLGLTSTDVNNIFALALSYTISKYN